MTSILAFLAQYENTSMPEQVKLALEVIILKEQQTLERFYAAVREATPQVRVLAERYGGDVAFNFDSNGWLVWVMALFGKDAPPIAPSTRSGQVLRDGAARPRLLRTSGIVSVLMKCCAEDGLSQLGAVDVHGRRAG